MRKTKKQQRGGFDFTNLVLPLVLFKALKGGGMKKKRLTRRVSSKKSHNNRPRKYVFM